MNGKRHAKTVMLGPLRHDLCCHVCSKTFFYPAMLGDHLHGGFTDGPGSARNKKCTPHRLQAALCLGAYLPYCHLCQKPVVATFGDEHDMSIGHISRMAEQGPLYDGQPWARYTYCTRPPTVLQSAQIFREEMEDTIRIIATAQRLHITDYDIVEIDGLSLEQAFGEQLWMFVA